MPSKRSYRYRVVDVFTLVPLEGNPLAVFPQSEGLDDITMQRIAREMNLSETVFIAPATLKSCVASLRIFTPTREMAFAGHPTVGASYVLRSDGRVPGNAESFSVQEKIGEIPIRITSGEPPLIWLSTPPIHFEKMYDPETCARALGLSVTDLLPVQPQVVGAGNPCLFIPVKSKEQVDRCSVDTSVFNALRPSEGHFALFVFAPTSEGAYSRMFAPEFGIIEDPATGSATGPLAAFMSRHNLLPKPGHGRFVSEQGTKMGRRSLLYFEVSSTDTDAAVPVGGHVTPVAEGTLTL